MSEKPRKFMAQKEGDILIGIWHHFMLPNPCSITKLALA